MSEMAYLCDMKKALLIIGTVLLLIGCKSQENRLQNGDLVFVGNPAHSDIGAETMDAAISAATGQEGSLNLTHVAIVEVEGDSVWIIDATTTRGVDRHPVDTFLVDFRYSDGRFPEFIVKRVKGIDTDAAVERAKALCGRSYDFRFLPDNEEMYCSELVQECYLDAEGKPVFGSVPMNWLAPDGTMPPYWERLFGQLGMAVPQGVPGTNPQRMSESEFLVEVPVKLVK